MCLGSQQKKALSASASAPPTTTYPTTFMLVLGESDCLRLSSISFFCPTMYPAAVQCIAVSASRLRLATAGSPSPEYPISYSVLCPAACQAGCYSASRLCKDSV